MNIKSYRQAQIEAAMSENIAREVKQLRSVNGHRPKAEIDSFIERIRVINGPMKILLAEYQA